MCRVAAPGPSFLLAAHSWGAGGFVGGPMQRKKGCGRGRISRREEEEKGLRGAGDVNQRRGEKTQAGDLAVGGALGTRGPSGKSQGVKGLDSGCPPPARRPEPICFPAASHAGQAGCFGATALNTKSLSHTPAPCPAGTPTWKGTGSLCRWSSQL